MSCTGATGLTSFLCHCDHTSRDTWTVKIDNLIFCLRASMSYESSAVEEEEWEDNIENTTLY